VRAASLSGLSRCAAQLLLARGRREVALYRESGGKDDGVTLIQAGQQRTASLAIAIASIVMALRTTSAQTELTAIRWTLTAGLGDAI
jgi:hypothetical protein